MRVLGIVTSARKPVGAVSRPRTEVKMAKSQYGCSQSPGCLGISISADGLGENMDPGQEASRDDIVFDLDELLQVQLIGEFEEH